MKQEKVVAYAESKIALLREIYNCQEVFELSTLDVCYILTDLLKDWVGYKVKEENDGLS